MPNIDRGMIKWMPFNSIISSKDVLNELTKERSKIKMPYLSDEQKSKIEKALIIAYYGQESIKIDYFYQGQILSLTSNIKKIDFTFHKIYFTKQTLLFEQIIKVY